MFSFLRKNAPAPAPLVDKILIPERAVREDAPRWQVVCDVVEFFNWMTDRALFLPSELPPNAKRIYLTDHYYAQVCNGGHDQFHSNAGESRDVAVASAQHCFRAAGMTAYGAIVDDFAKWLGSRKGRAYGGVARGFSNRVNPRGEGSSLKVAGGTMAPLLEQLDSRLYAEDKANSYHLAMTRWILSLPEVEVVPDADYRARLDALAARNPELAQRQDDSAVERLAAQLDWPIQVGAARACLNATPPRELYRMLSGGTATWFGRTMPSWNLETGSGRRTLLVLPDAYVLMPSDIPGAKELKNLDGLLALSEGRVTAAMVEEAREHAKGQDVAQATMLLLRSAKVEGPVARIYYVRPEPDAAAHRQLGDPVAGYGLVMQSGQAFILFSGSRGARLISGSDSSKLAEVTASELRSAVRARRTRRELRNA